MMHGQKNIKIIKTNIPSSIIGSICANFYKLLN